MFYRLAHVYIEIWFACEPTEGRFLLASSQDKFP